MIGTPPFSDASQKRSSLLELTRVPRSGEEAFPRGAWERGILAATALTLLLLTGCSGGPAASPVASAGPSASTANLPILAVIGKSISEATKEEKLTFDKKAFVIDGPNKGVPIGVKGKTAAGNDVRLYFLSGPKQPGEENPKWELGDFDATSVTGVAVKEGGEWRKRGTGVPDKLE
jgi:hypothetical protein